MLLVFMVISVIMILRASCELINALRLFHVFIWKTQKAIKRRAPPGDQTSSTKYLLMRWLRLKIWAGVAAKTEQVEQSPLLSARTVIYTVAYSDKLTCDQSVSSQNQGALSRVFSSILLFLIDVFQFNLNLYSPTGQNRSRIWTESGVHFHFNKERLYLLCLCRSFADYLRSYTGTCWSVSSSELASDSLCVKPVISQLHILPAAPT